MSSSEDASEALGSDDSSDDSSDDDGSDSDGGKQQPKKVTPKKTAKTPAPKALAGGPRKCGGSVKPATRVAASKADATPGAGLKTPAVAASNAVEDDDIIPGFDGPIDRDENAALLAMDNLSVRRQPLLPNLLIVHANEVAKLRAPFKSPVPGTAAQSDELRHRLAQARTFVPWGNRGGTPLPLFMPPPPPPPPPGNEDAPAVEPLVVYAPSEAEVSDGATSVTVEPHLCAFLRQHQREGVQFMFECVAGLRAYEGTGCILADDMGLGKTLQAITLIWTVLNQGMRAGGGPMGRRALVVCPTSLVANWDAEFAKWLKGRARTLALAESCRADVVDSITRFLTPNSRYQVLIVSYETFRIHATRFHKEGTCDLLICDEAHRLKNDATLTNRALNSLPCRRRVLLSGTPLQNDLDEFFAMVDFCNPGVLGTQQHFRRTYSGPILRGREPDAGEAEALRGQKQSGELSVLVNAFILRRTNTLLSAHLPPKVIEIVCCRLSPLQRELYAHFLRSKTAKAGLAGQATAKVLGAITALRKLVNHPKLIWDVLSGNGSAKESADGFEGAAALFPPQMVDMRTGQLCHGWENHSGKFLVLSRLLARLRPTSDRIVLVSNYTQTLDLMEKMCQEKSYPFVRLDGNTSQAKRQKLVRLFCDPSETQFVFLLSSKAGGCGLNLIGANRLILFDPDWNPATDKQAAARVWRDGQTKRVFVYRFLAAGTIEEKVYQRQLSKEGLQSVVGEGGSERNTYSEAELRELFRLRVDTRSDTHDGLNCTRCPPPVPAAVAINGDGEEAAGAGGARATEDGGQAAAQVGHPKEEDLASWAHHTSVATVPDPLFAAAAGDDVTFVFTCTVDGQKVEEPSGISRTAQGAMAGRRPPLATIAPPRQVDAPPAAKEPPGTAQAAVARTPACPPWPPAEHTTPGLPNDDDGDNGGDDEARTSDDEGAEAAADEDERPKGKGKSKGSAVKPKKKKKKADMFDRGERAWANRLDKR